MAPCFLIFRRRYQQDDAGTNAVSFAHDSHIANFTVPNASSSFISDFASMAQVEDFNDDGLCKHFGCVDDAIAGGFCATHALGRRDLSSAHASSALAPADAMCKAFGCVEAAVIRGMCSAHLTDDMLYQMHVPQVSRSIVNTPLSSGATNAVSAQEEAAAAQKKVHALLRQRISNFM